MNNRNSNNNSGGGLFTFLVGIAAGAAAGYYLSTEEGRRMRTRLAERTQELRSEATQYARTTSERVNENLGKAVNQGKSYVNDLTETVKTRVDDLNTSARQTMDKTSGSFQEGIARGKAKLDQQKSDIDHLVQDPAKKEK